MSHATHANAALTPRARLRLARLIVDQGWPIPRAAERYDVSWRTAKKWTDRYRAEGPAGMVDRSSRPHRQPNRTPIRSVRKIVHLRWKQRLGQVEIEARDDETKETATDVLKNAVAWFAARGVTVHRVLSDNGSCYKSYLWRDTCTELGITPKKTRPYRPQTNGKIERFHRTLAEGWAFKKFYNSESARLAALPAWVHQYNHHRPHSAIGKAAPITRLDNLAGHHS